MAGHLAALPFHASPPSHLAPHNAHPSPPRTPSCLHTCGSQTMKAASSRITRTMWGKSCLQGEGGTRGVRVGVCVGWREGGEGLSGVNSAQHVHHVGGGLPAGEPARLEVKQGRPRSRGQHSGAAPGAGGSAVGADEHLRPLIATAQGMAACKSSSHICCAPRTRVNINQHGRLPDSRQTSGVTRLTGR